MLDVEDDNVVPSSTRTSVVVVEATDIWRITLEEERNDLLVVVPVPGTVFWMKVFDDVYDLSELE